MKKEYSTEYRATTRTYHEFLEKNAKGEKIAFEFSKGTDSGTRHSLPRLWEKAGYTKEVLKTYWCVSTYVTSASGCWGMYNPTTKLSEDGNRQVLNFDWMLEATEENKQKIINEIFRLANA